MIRNHRQSRAGSAAIYAVATSLVCMAAIFIACSDAPSLTNSDNPCSDGEVWDPIQEECAAESSQSGGNSGTGTGTNDGTGGDNTGPSPNSGTNTEEPPCVNLGCDQVDCPEGTGPTSLSGKVTTPNGVLPLPNVSVYIPNAPLEPITQGASCERCEDMLTGQPLVHTTTTPNGDFYLEDVPVGEDIPLVIQTGKWRRKVHISNVEECVENPIVDHHQTRLPKNQSEGDIPQIAITTGECDALECLMYKIGLDDEEFTTNTGDGSVHLFWGDYGDTGLNYYAEGGTDRFDNSFPTGNLSFPDSSSWSEDLNNLLDYDIILNSCECGPFPEQKSQAARQALQDFSYQGGRVFLSHWHNTWLEGGPSDFQSVASWAPAVSTNTVANGQIDTSFAGGQRLREWMHQVNGLNAAGGVDITEWRITVESINSAVAERWIYLPHSGVDWDHYFAFNTPVGAQEEDECGRVVFSDLHVAAGNVSSLQHPFPTGCTDAPLTPQEKALVFMLFDLSACITDCIPLRCEDISGACGLEPDGCGSHIECTECCVDLDEPCTKDSDCCDSLWCDGDTGLCTDRCRAPGEACTQHGQCCSEVCDTEQHECLDG